MANEMMTREDANTLQKLVQRVGLEDVLNCLAGICAAKSSEDRSIPWFNAGHAISDVADEVAGFFSEGKV